MAAAKVFVGLHPRGRAPRRGEELRFGVAGKRLLGKAQNVLFVALDGKVRKGKVAVRLIIGIPIEGEVVGADGQAQEV